MKETLLTTKQIKDLYETMVSMEQITEKGHDWEFVGVFSQKVEDGDGIFVGTILKVYDETTRNVKTMLRLEAFEE